MQLVRDSKPMIAAINGPAIGVGLTLVLPFDQILAAKVELSGGVTLDRIPELASTGADYVSVGALTHSAPASDLSFELEPDA